MKYNTPSQNKVFFLPNRSVGMPPKREPSTVPQSAMDMMKMPWKVKMESPKNQLVPHNSLMGWLAPEITTVSNPNKKPARAAVREILKRFRSILVGFVKNMEFTGLSRYNPRSALWPRYGH